MVPDALDEGCYVVVVGDGFLALAGDAVGDASRFDEGGHVLGDEAGVF